MAALAEMLIRRHIAMLRQHQDPQRIAALLERSGLRAENERVTSSEGASVDEEHCYHYKAAVRSLFGDAAYSFARVNFILGGCGCRDCKTPRR